MLIFSYAPPALLRLGDVLEFVRLQHQEFQDGQHHWNSGTTTVSKILTNDHEEVVQLLFSEYLQPRTCAFL